jgi:hypothetical protein
MEKLEIDYTEEVILLVAPAIVGVPIDPDVVLMALDRLFGKEEYDNHDVYTINTAGVVPEKPGPIRDRLWRWIERMEKRLGIDLEVWGCGGEYLTPATVSGRIYGIDDFGRTDTEEYCIEEELAESLRSLAELHHAWRIFASSTAGRKNSGSPAKW